MRRTLAYALGLASVLALLLFFPMPAQAVGADGIAEDNGAGVGALSDRYDSLNILGNSLTEEEGVVIETRIGVLTSVNRALDNSDVRFTGEVVGSVLNAQTGHKWVNMMGTTQASISVFMTDEQTELVKNVGSYHATGTSLKVTGIYHVACPMHQGELDVHASSVEMVDAGGPVTHLVDKSRMLAAFVLCAVAFAIVLAYLCIRIYRRKRGDA